MEDVRSMDVGGRPSCAVLDRVFDLPKASPFMPESDHSISLKVRIRPRAKLNAITGRLGDALKVSLTAPPVDGKANQACIEFFAKLLKVSRSSVTIAAGQTSRNKVIRVVGLSAKEVEARLNLGSPS
jgi:uncharacterized protein (TIGR00251 family)